MVWSFMLIFPIYVCQVARVQFPICWPRELGPTSYFSYTQLYSEAPQSLLLYLESLSVWTRSILSLGKRNKNAVFGGRNQCMSSDKTKDKGGILIEPHKQKYLGFWARGFSLAF